MAKNEKHHAKYYAVFQREIEALQASNLKLKLENKQIEEQHYS